jgi:hypothetical protein
MAIEDRTAIVSVVEETYALTGRVLSTDIPGDLASFVRPEILDQLRRAQFDPLVTDQEMLRQLQGAYFDLVQTVIQLRSQLLGATGESHDPALRQVGLTGNGRLVKVNGFRRALGRLLSAASPAARFRWIRKAFEWGNIILGSLGSVPVVGALADPIQELKDSVEAQADDDQNQVP